MALAERAELVARLSLKDELSPKLKGVQGKMGQLGKAAGRAGKAISVGLGAGAAVGIGITFKAVRSGLDSLAELESATTSVDAAIKQMGLTGKVTSTQIATWANEIEASVGAAFDDKAITAAATNLIRYGKVTTDNLRPALVVMTDLAVKTGSVESASALLGKAMADPTKAAGKLARVGIILTKQQQKQIKAMVDAGDAAGAQKVLLDALTGATKGAAAASQGPYQRSIATLQDAWEDATKALAVGFLPILEEVRDMLTTELAKPSTLARIREFGEGLAGGFRSLVGFVKGIPWDQVGDAMKLAGTGAKAIYDAFTSLPPWVQTAVLTGWGLNKVTGGLLGGVVSELGKGLVKGVLGMNAGVVNIKAGVVTGAGGVPTGGGVAPVGGGMSTLGKLFLVGEAIGLVAAVAAVGQAVKDSGLKQAQDITTTLDKALAQPNTMEELNTKLAAIDTGIAKLKADPVAAALITGPTIAELERQRQKVVDVITAQRVAADRITTRVEGMRGAMVGATRSSTSAIVGAIRGIQRPIVNVRVNAAYNLTRVSYSTGTTLNSGGGTWAEGARRGM